MSGLWEVSEALGGDRYFGAVDVESEDDGTLIVWEEAGPEDEDGSTPIRVAARYRLTEQVDFTFGGELLVGAVTEDGRTVRLAISPVLYTVAGTPVQIGGEG